MSYNEKYRAKLPSNLKNRYFALRHGESIPNIFGIIVSDPDQGCEERFGLSDKGKGQARKASKDFLALAARCKTMGDSSRSETQDPASYREIVENVIIYCSTFSRARQTAQIFKENLEDVESSVKIPMIFTDRLRERYFGKYWDGKSNQHYQDVWQHDLDQISATYDEESRENANFEDVEEVEEVLDRALSIILDAEQEFTNKSIVLVSHGDTLQILQTVFEGLNPRYQRNLPHLNTAEVRLLVPSNDGTYKGFEM